MNRNMDDSILGRDPAGPLAPLGGPEPLLQRTISKSMVNVGVAFENTVSFCFAVEIIRNRLIELIQIDLFCYAKTLTTSGTGCCDVSTKTAFM
jgi:hypothetical protein